MCFLGDGLKVARSWSALLAVMAEANERVRQSGADVAYWMEKAPIAFPYDGEDSVIV